MYWPLGAPRVYAAPRKQRLRTQNDEDDDEKAAEGTDYSEDALLGLSLSRNGQLFATITATTLSIWQTSPVILLVTAERSESSLKTYGANTTVLLRPDCSIAAVQTRLGYLVTYELHIDPQSRVYQHVRTDEKNKRLSIAARLPEKDRNKLGYREVLLRFRMVIKIDAGIGKALALDDELVVATQKPAAVQCIKWQQDDSGSQTITEVLNRLPWMTKSSVSEIVYNRAMNMYVWISNDGHAFAVQKLAEGSPKVEGQGKFFKGYPLHTPETSNTRAIKAAINARFSQLAIGTENGQINVYTARDYQGSLPLSHTCTPPYSKDATGALKTLSYSPDGYCLFAGYERGWVMWSVYGKLGGNSFVSEVDLSRENDEGWLLGVSDAIWIETGTRIILTRPTDRRLWVIDVAKNAVTSCFGPSNISRMLLHTNSSLMIYRGHDLSDMTSISSDASLWQTVQIPDSFLERQAPIRSAVISPDGRYVAVAGRRGLAHYSVQSGRWKTFENEDEENSFVVRGGMFWYQHILFATVETDGHDELRLYSREMSLNDSKVVFIEPLPAPVVALTPCGDDSLLIYTYENNLYHYVINTVGSTLEIVQVGAIGLHGIVRAPARVRSITWYLPEYQLLDGDPSQDVMNASILFLVDAKLVLLQPTNDDKGDLRYDMKIIANAVEFFSFTRDQISPRDARLTPPSDAGSPTDRGPKPALGLVDSLWYFDGQNIQCWPDMQEIIQAAPEDSPRDIPPPIPIPVDFYPTSVALNKAVIVGIESDLVQRHSSPFALFRVSIRTQLFLPHVLRHSLSHSDGTTALSLCHHYSTLPYFSHALEVLLHTVLDDEVDSAPSSEQALLPSVLSFLQSFPDYLDILVQCTRKTELRSWRTLFATLPPPRELFKESLRKGQLKTAGGYLLVLHTLEEGSDDGEEAINLMQRAKIAGAWDLCRELARFLMALDQSGDTLRDAMQKIDTAPSPIDSVPEVNGSEVALLQIPKGRPREGTITQESIWNGDESSMASPGTSDRSSQYEGARDYFSRPSSSHQGP